MRAEDLALLDPSDPDELSVLRDAMEEVGLDPDADVDDSDAVMIAKFGPDGYAEATHKDKRVIWAHCHRRRERDE